MSPGLWRLGILGLVGLLLGGCSNGDRFIRLEIRTLPPAVQAAASEQGKFGLAVAPLRDARPEGSRLGSRTSLWGTETYFNVEGGAIGDVAAQVFIDYLKHEKGWRTWFAKPGVTAPEGVRYATLTGDLQECVVEAQSWGVITTVTVRTKLALEVAGVEMGKPISSSLVRAESDWTFGFGQDVAERLLNNVLLESFQQFLADPLMEELDRRARNGA